MHHRLSAFLGRPNLSGLFREILRTIREDLAAFDVIQLGYILSCQYYSGIPPWPDWTATLMLFLLPCKRYAWLRLQSLFKTMASQRGNNVQVCVASPFLLSLGSQWSLFFLRPAQRLTRYSSCLYPAEITTPQTHSKNRPQP